MEASEKKATRFTMTFRVFRYDPDRDSLPRREDFSVECGEDDQLLDVLVRIKETLDPSLAFRSSCRHGICGSCAIRAGNKPVLACKTPVRELRDRFGDVVPVDPLDRAKAVRDLVVDRDDYWAKYHAVRPFAETLRHKGGDTPLRPSAIARIADADTCINCSICYFSCPVVRIEPPYLGPSAFARAYRFEADPRDHSSARLRIVNRAVAGVWDCVKCLQCSEACPKGVDPFRKITALHELGAKAGAVRDGVRLRHAKGFSIAMRQVGFINEIVLALYTMGLRMIRLAPRGVLMFFRRKLHLNPFWPRSMRLEEIKKLWRRKRP